MRLINKMLRKWLRKRLIDKLGTCNTEKSVSYMEGFFLWVYDAPITQWKDRLWCIPRAACLKDAEKLFWLLHK